MAFMFIVTIIVIAICRVHMRRSLLSRCPAASSRTLANGRVSNLHGNHLNGLPFYDLDLYLNRPGLNNDLMSVNPLLVTYNINNGVQFVGRPVDPPPYCEIVASPPREGPPPPYASQENLRKESEVHVEPEQTESDALLGAASVAQISVISCNAMDLEAETQTQAPEEALNHVSEAQETSSSQKNVEESKSEALDILVLNGDADAGVKLSDGESSSLVTSSDISKGAVKKIVSSKSFEGASRRKSRGSPKNHLRKF